MVDGGAFLAGHPTRSTLRSVWQKPLAVRLPTRAMNVAPTQVRGDSQVSATRLMPSGLDRPRGVLLLEAPCRMIFIGKEVSKSYSVPVSILDTLWSGGTRHAYKSDQIPLRDEADTTNVADAECLPSEPSSLPRRSCLEGVLVHDTIADSDLISYQSSIDRRSCMP